MKRHVLVVNTKAYREGTGARAVRLARVAHRLSRESGTEIILCVQPSDIPSVSETITTFAQHIDPVEPGPHTGHILPEAVKAAGAKGTLINHSERRIGLNEIGNVIKRAKQLKMITLCCVPDTRNISRVSSLNPDYVAIEPPELIGTGTPVSKARPSLISRAVELAEKANPGIRVLCGAGISSGEDVARALELGANGVLVASHVVKSRNPEMALLDILRGFG